MRMHGLRAAAAAALLLACRSSEPTHDPSPPLASPPSEPGSPPLPRTRPAPAPTLDDHLDAHAVTADDYVRLELYTWTTPAQIEVLRAGGPLLVADAATGGYATPFNRLLADMVAQRRPGHELAALLHGTPGLTKRRYAWPSPFATVLGKGAERYGAALIHVRLRPEAVTARLDPSADPPWSFRDGSGREVPPAEILAEPQRLGAVYHLRVGADESIPFREHVLCNEAMVAEWSVGTTAIAERVAAERRLVLELAASPFAAPSPAVTRWRAWPQWLDPGPAPTSLSRWHRALAFDNPRYQPTPTGLEAIAQALAAYDPTGPALVGGSAAQASQ
jgi:hypothetical protein